MKKFLLALCVLSAMVGCRTRVGESDLNFSENEVGVNGFISQNMGQRSWCYAFPDTLVEGTGALSGMASFDSTNQVRVAFRGKGFQANYEPSQDKMKLSLQWQGGDGGFQFLTWGDNRGKAASLNFDRANWIELYRFDGTGDPSNPSDLNGRAFCVAEKTGRNDVALIKFFANGTFLDGKKGPMVRMNTFDGQLLVGSWSNEGTKLILTFTETRDPKVVVGQAAAGLSKTVKLPKPNVISYQYLGEGAPRQVVTMMTDQNQKLTAVRAN